MTFDLFGPFPNLRYGFSRRQDGSMDRHRDSENRERYFRARDIEPEYIVTADLVHGTKVVAATKQEVGTMIPRVDGLVTNERGVFLSATGADCFLLYFYDPFGNAVGIAHAGWRGVLGGIVKRAVETLRLAGATPQNLLVGIGPGIRSCHFEISEGDRHLYKNYSSYVSEYDSRVFVDLPGIIISQLEAEGIERGRIEDANVCTYCTEQDYFSYRRDRPERVQPMVGYIGVV